MAAKQETGGVDRLRRSLAFGLPAAIAATAIDQFLGTRPASALSDPTPMPPRNSEISDKEKFIEGVHKGATLQLRYKRTSEGNTRLPENLHGTSALLSSVVVDRKKGYILTVSHGFKDTNGTDPSPYRFVFDAKANNYLPPNNQYFAYKAEGEDLDGQTLGHLDAISLSGRFGADVALVRMRDPERLDDFNVPEVGIATDRPRPGTRFSLCGYPDLTDEKEHYWATYLGHVMESEMVGNPDLHPNRELYAFVMNPASNDNQDYDAFSTVGMSGSGFVGPDGKVYGVLSRSMKGPSSDSHDLTLEQTLARNSSPELAELVHSGSIIGFAAPVTERILVPYIDAFGKISTQRI